MSANIILFVVGVDSKKQIFKQDGTDTEKLKEFLKLYSKHYRVDILAFSLENDKLSFILRDQFRNGGVFLDNVIEAFEYYYMEKNDTRQLFHRKKNKRHLTEGVSVLEAMKRLHGRGINSLEYYRNHEFYLKPDLVRTDFVLNSISFGKGNNKKDFLNEMVSEPNVAYADSFRKLERFEVTKKSKRILRAEDTLKVYLTELGMTKEELLSSENEHTKILVIDRFRKETDLSFRDIGFVLDLSHTSVIRYHNRPK